MTDMFEPTYYEVVACVEREIALRKRVYPRWVAAGRMTQDKADREIQTMEAALRRLQASARHQDTAA